MKIQILNTCDTLKYAAEELKKYVYKMCGVEAAISSEEGDLKLGLLSELGLSTEGVLDPMLDDVIDVKVSGLSGYIAGSNARSVLMGVYNYLKSAGCAWVRPGVDGEFIPHFDLAEHSFTMRKKADYTFRGECIEGAVSYEHLRDTIEWLPKVNMNFFMIEQLVPFNYMYRWYSHEYNTLRDDEGLGYKEIAEYVSMLERDITLRGLQLHALGHGYFYEPYGIHYETPKTVYNVTDEARETMALLGGERGLSHNSPFHTQMCLSNGKARRDHVLWLANYLEEKPYIDFLHVWLGDGANNQCECERCAVKSTSDWYIMLLNELDAELTSRGINTKIVFIMYNDTMWAPDTERFNNPDRFVVTVTVQARDHGLVFSPERYKGTLPKYQRNNINYRNGTSKMLAYKDKWKPTFDGRSFLFEYRMYTDHYVDPGYMSVAEIMYKDCVILSELGFDGIISDKTQRSYFPTGLPMAIMGETLFDKSLDYEKYVSDYFDSAFGGDGALAREYLERVTEYIDPRAVRVVVDVTYEDTGTGNTTSTGGVKGKPENIPRLEKIYPLAEAFKETVSRNLELSYPCHRKSWRLMQYHTEYVKRYADILIALAKSDEEGAYKLYEDMLDFLSHMEAEYSLDFDLHLFARKMKSMIKN